MSPRHNVVITGTGRAGTTFLVELLTHLGLDTGFSIDEIPNKKSQDARAGLEHDLRKGGCPLIVKDPRFCDYAKDVIQDDGIIIDQVLIPVRNLDAAAASRQYVSKTSAEKLSNIQRLMYMVRPRSFAGGLRTKSKNPEKQKEILQKQIYKLMFALSDTDIPVTLMHYPRIMQDSEYLYTKLKPVLQNIELEYFCEIFDKVIQPELVHSFHKEDI